MQKRCQPHSPPAAAVQNAGAFTDTPQITARFWTAVTGVQGSHRFGWRAVLPSEVKRVNRIMPALLKPEREPTRQLGIHQELHAARGRMR